ncbi:DMT family transporter [Paraburkholderia susongensis]|uniref:Permease of the drug/metabolite transporter (DMT) superfamily n=1 Tax=Paraburkholderia susongensis TaxID=1515439 RepID=A0A1X7LNJ2_9BURK|nr:DMT family transporter [Paraburkholderia susongensis]SMG55087.1 Permease of the drug/metabolite transporter (DMT) superfamily [Paraburkholderia susongensis]
MTQPIKTTGTTGPRDSARFLTQPQVLVILATVCCLLWGSSYPAIKIGYALLGITQGDIPSKLVFAGYRFVFAGLFLLILAALSKKPLFNFSRRNAGQLMLLGFTQTAIQYVFFYIGLAYTTGVRGSILNSTTTFFSVLLAHFIYKNDKVSPRKAVGCLLGFVGVMVVNFGDGSFEFAFTLLGEGFIVIAAFVLSAASIYGKRISQGMDVMVMTGYQLGFGGAVLVAAGYATGGTLSGFTAGSAALLGYLALLSAVAFTLWSLLLKYNQVGKVTVFNFLVPVFGTALSAICLNENIMELKNLVALVLVCSGIWLVTRSPQVRSGYSKPARTVASAQECRQSQG